MQNNLVWYAIKFLLLCFQSKNLKKSYFVGLHNSQDKLVTDTEPMVAPS